MLCAAHGDWKNDKYRVSAVPWCRRIEMQTAHLQYTTRSSGGTRAPCTVYHVPQTVHVPCTISGTCTAKHMLYKYDALCIMYHKRCTYHVQQAVHGSCAMYHKLCQYNVPKPVHIRCTMYHRRLMYNVPWAVYVPCTMHHSRNWRTTHPLKTYLHHFVLVEKAAFCTKWICWCSLLMEKL